MGVVICSDHQGSLNSTFSDVIQPRSQDRPAGRLKKEGTSLTA